MQKSTSLVIAAVALAGAAGLSPARAQKVAPPAEGARKSTSSPAPAARGNTVSPQAGRAVAVASTAAAAAAAPGAAAAAGSLTEGQLDAAQRVFLGKADCEFGEQVDVSPVDGRPGHFRLRHRQATYQLVPQETTTGAVRLEDRRAGIVWLQIPSKSMLMNSKIGQRLVDNCMMDAQRS
jgi:hypothetical protein